MAQLDRFSSHQDSSIARPLQRVSLKSAGFDADLASKVREHLQGCIESRVFPGAVVLIARRAEVVLEMPVGHETYEPDAAPMRVDSLFDLASLTKVCATTPAVLRLVDAGKLSLETKVQSVLPEFRGPGKEVVTVRHLLTHTGGLVAYVRFWRTVQGLEGGRKARGDPAGCC